MKNALLIGATGNLGALIGQKLLARGAKLRVLVREGSQSKLDAALAGGAEVVTDESTAFAGIDTVVSAVQGGAETIVDAQSRWLAFARDAGVKRFIPSDYSYDYFGLAEGENPNSDVRRAFAVRAEAERGAMEVTHVMNGCFLDHRVLFGFLGAFDLNAGKAFCWGDGEQKMDFTTYEDTAAYTAAVALESEPVGRTFMVSGETLNFHELVSEVEAATGTKLQQVRKGSMADLDAAIAQAMAAEPANFFAWLPNMYYRGMLSGKGKLTELRNSRYPEIQPASIRSYLGAPVR